MNEILSLSDSLLALNGDENAIIEKGRFLSHSIPNDRLSANYIATLKVKSMRSASLCLILSTMSRKFLKYLAPSVSVIAAGFNTASGLSIEAFQLCSKVTSLVEDSPLPVRLFDSLLTQVENYIKTAYASKEDNIAAERELLINGTIPSTLYKTVIQILTDLVPKLVKPLPQDIKQIDRLSLAIYDYTWLGIVPDRRTWDFKRNRLIDILRRETAIMDFPKSPGRQAVNIRRCTRCCEVSTEPGGPRSQAAYGMWVTLQIMKFCFCGGMYVLEKADAPSPQKCGATRDETGKNESEAVRI
ncbi:mediator complex subunit [Ascosphaera aggregata]|nr:mediator complex subunit [Ascosphaera aggregata]